MNNPFSLVGKVILVTGASSGIGRAIAVTCARMGASLVITGRNKDRLNDTINTLEGDNHLLFSVNLINQEEVCLFVDSLPKLDGIVHCAGIGNRTFCKDITNDDYKNVIDTNLKSPILLQTEILCKKKLNKASSIVFIASMAAKYPSVGNALYSASKGGMISYAKCLGLELASRQIRVNCICPAMVWTDLILQGDITKEDLIVAQQKYPLKRYGQPEDVANLAVFLLSDASSWMTGSCIDISGGGEGALV